MQEQTFGQKLRELRRMANVTQRQLADQVGVDFSYISKLENDRIPPPAADTIVAICQILNIDPNELLALTGKLPSDVQETIGKSEAAQRFLREARELTLSEQEWDSMLKSLRHLRGD